MERRHVLPWRAARRRLAVYVFSRVKHINPLSLGDIASAATPFGLFFGRIANFINSEVVGRVTDVPWAMVFPGAGDLAASSEPAL